MSGLKRTMDVLYAVGLPARGMIVEKVGIVSAPVRARCVGCRRDVWYHTSPLGLYVNAREGPRGERVRPICPKCANARRDGDAREEGAGKGTMEKAVRDATLLADLEIGT